jgi:hypothetical protein
VNIFVDTSVWSLALRRDSPPDAPEVRRLREALGADAVHTTGLVLQELLQGCRGPRAHARIVDRFAAIALVVPTRDDHIEAARLRNACRRRGVQVGTVDALLAELCIVHELVMLSTDRDFALIAASTPLRLWQAP